MALVFLAKSLAAERLPKFRGASMLEACLKWYTNVLMVLLDECEESRFEEESGALGFKQGKSTNQLSAPMRNALSKSVGQQ